MIFRLLPTGLVLRACRAFNVPALVMDVACHPLIQGEVKTAKTPVHITMIASAEGSAFPV
jgi:hypothetical protein